MIGKAAGSQPIAPVVYSSYSCDVRPLEGGFSGDGGRCSPECGEPGAALQLAGGLRPGCRGGPVPVAAVDRGPVPQHSPPGPQQALPPLPWRPDGAASSRAP